MAIANIALNAEQQQRIPSRSRRVVQFSEHVRIEIIANVHDTFTHDEMNSCFYTKEELERQKRLQKDIAHELGGFYSADELFHQFGIPNKKERNRRRLKTTGYLNLMMLHGHFWNAPLSPDNDVSHTACEIITALSLLYSCETRASADIAREQACKVYERVNHRKAAPVE
mmetsp:Transcript_7166/g.12494  ORF Transcript_7166/g.12494 Transcript_7166/m.12494 type:complete len:170 (-) Transcript_7166:47-556(-)